MFFHKINFLLSLLVWKRNYISISLLTLTSLLIATICFSQETVPVLFSGPIIKRTPYKIYLNDAFIGYMGDSINAPLGQQKISIKGPYGAWLDMYLNFGIGRISNDGVSIRQPTCGYGYEYVKSWPWYYQPLRARTIIHIKNPIIGMRNSKLPYCPRYRLKVFRKQGVVKVAIESVPEGATIYIDGIRKGKTPKTLGIPYDKRSDQFNIVVRKDGYINYSEKLNKPFPNTKYIFCNLSRF